MNAALDALAVVMDGPERMSLRRLPLAPPSDADVVVDVDWSGVSAGTERLLWTGRMPPFPGMGYPLVPGYEVVGRVAEAGPASGRQIGETVFVPGANCYGDVRGLFGGSASRIVTPGARALRIDPQLADRGALLALAATARHALAAPDAKIPDLIVGHGALGRLLARVAMATGAPPPMVWEVDRARLVETEGYPVAHPDDDPRRDYAAPYDASGDPRILDTLIGRLAHDGAITLAGFYAEPLAFAFPPAFMREARIRVAAEFGEDDLLAVRALVESGRLSLDGLITHRADAQGAAAAYAAAFDAPDCLKMILDWRTC